MKTQDEIRMEYQDLCREIDRLESEQVDAENELLGLQHECQHPNIGTGADDRGFAVSPNECPDCGFYREEQQS